MKFYPYIGIGVLKFGDGRNDCLFMLSTAYVSSDLPWGNKVMGYSDYFEEFDINLLFDLEEKLVAVELFLPEIEFEGIEITAWGYLEIFDFFKDKSTVEETGSGFSSLEYGIGFQEPPNKNESPKYVIVFSKGYYDDPPEDDNWVDEFLDLAKGL